MKQLFINTISYSTLTAALAAIYAYTIITNPFLISMAGYFLPFFLVLIGFYRPVRKQKLLIILVPIALWLNLLLFEKMFQLAEQKCTGNGICAARIGAALNQEALGGAFGLVLGLASLLVFAILIFVKPNEKGK